MSLFRRGTTWWYEFWFAGRRIQESTKATSKTLAKNAETKRRRELEMGFNGLEDGRDEQIRPIREIAKDYLSRKRPVKDALREGGKPGMLEGRCPQRNPNEFDARSKNDGAWSRKR